MSDNSKQIFRERILTLLRNQKEEERLSKSLVIKKRLFETQEFREAKIILFYASFDGEVRTFEMMAEAQQLGKTIGLPRIMDRRKGFVSLSVTSLEDDLEPGEYGIQEPKMDPARLLVSEQLDLVIVPGVAFDRRNNRLGRGGGYYDRFLGSLPDGVPIFGLAYDFQIVDDLPSPDRHDVPVSRVLTD